MALSAEQQQQLEFQKAMMDLNKPDTTAQTVSANLNLINIAKDILIENDRNKPVSERGISSSDITTLANQLRTFIHG